MSKKQEYVRDTDQCQRFASDVCHLVDSSGIIDEMVLEKLRLNVRALIEAEPDKADLVDLCQGVLFHDNMKAFGLNQLVKLYVNWLETHQEIEQANVLAE